MKSNGSKDIFERLLLPPETTIQRCMQVMTGPPGAGMVLVTGPDRRLLGVVVDSDLRKAMLKGSGLDTPLSKVMNPKPFTLPHTLDRSAVAEQFRKMPRAYIPLLDAKGCVRGLAHVSGYLSTSKARPNWVVLLVGGAGKRLLPLTENQPKPLLQVGNKPLLETIVEQFTAMGFVNFVMCVNHHAEQISRYFGDGSRFSANIRYVHEKKRMGTAGPLSLLPDDYTDPLIVMNGDLLTKIDFRSLLDFHAEEENLATVCVREYDFQVPFGVVQMDGHRLRSIVEKPVHRFFVNAGIYVLSPQVLSWLPRHSYYEMPDFLEKISRRRKSSVGCFPIREYWIDIGQLPDYERAQNEYAKFF